MKFRWWILVGVPIVLVSGGCSLLKDEPDAKVVYSDPLDDSWYKEPAAETSVPDQTAQARPLSARNSSVDDVQPEDTFGSSPAQDPSWGSPMDAPVGASPSTGFEEGMESSEIVGAPIGGGSVPDSVPKSQDRSLVASRSGVGTDAGDSFPGVGGAHVETDTPGLRLGTAPPRALADSGSSGGFTAPGRDPVWNPPSQENPVPPPRALESSTPNSPLQSPEGFGNPSSTVTPIDPTFEDSPPSVRVSSNSIPPNVGGGPPAGPPPSDPMTVSVPSPREEPAGSPKPDQGSPSGPVPDAETLKNQAVAEYKSGNFPESTKLFRQFQNTYPDKSTDWVQWHLAQSLLEQGLWGESGEEFRKLVGSPNRELRAEALLKLGIIDAKRGNYEIAQNRWNRILENYPDTKAATRATQELAQNRP